MQEWLGEPGENKLTDWDISRDAPYFGFEIPGATEQVLLRLARRADRLHGLVHRTVREDGGSTSTSTGARTAATELYHFIGKDILYFHALFWPAMLEHAGYRTPTSVLRARLPHRQRREDVQVARHLHHRANLPGSASIRNTCATTSPPS